MLGSRLAHDYPGQKFLRAFSRTIEKTLFLGQQMLFRRSTFDGLPYCILTECNLSCVARRLIDLDLVTFSVDEEGALIDMGLKDYHGALDDPSLSGCVDDRLPRINDEFMRAFLWTSAKATLQDS